MSTCRAIVGKARAGAVGRRARVRPPRGGETILVVEDEPPILSVTQRILEQLGYTVLAASTPGEASSLAREHAGRLICW